MSARPSFSKTRRWRQQSRGSCSGGWREPEPASAALAARQQRKQAHQGRRCEAPSVLSPNVLEIRPFHQEGLGTNVGEKLKNSSLKVVQVKDELINIDGSIQELEEKSYINQSEIMVL